MRTAFVVALLFVSPLLAAAASCTADDKTKMDAAGGGSAPTSFGGKCYSCGKKAYHVFGGFKKDEFNTCVEQTIGLSESCSGCFADAAAYLAANCKVKCLVGWCKPGCLSCGAQAQATAKACAGVDVPPAAPCLAMNYTQAVHNLMGLIV